MVHVGARGFQSARWRRRGGDGVVGRRVGEWRRENGRQRVREDAALALRFATPSRVARCSLPRSASSRSAESSYTASGTDAYAYVTQADLWLSGRLTVPVPIANDVPWPRPLSTFIPFGYAVVANESAIASAVGPGTE